MFRQIAQVLLRWHFWLPFLINQCGSIAYNFLLGTTDISLASPICNSLTFIFTGLTARLALGERQPITFRTVAGTTLIVAGVGLCVASKLDVRG